MDAATVDVIVGKVVKAHGTRGDVVVELHTDEPERRFAAGSAVEVALIGRRLTVRQRRHLDGRLVVSFAGVVTRNEAESLVGAELSATVPADQRPADKAEYYDRHLIGLAVRRQDGQPAGVVVEVTHGVAQDILVVETHVGRRLVPFVDALVPTVDVDAGYITVADMPGLLDEV